MPEATCHHCGSLVWWVASENRWCSASNDHSLCRESPNNAHKADLPTSPVRWS